MIDMLKKVKETITKHHLLHTGDKVLVALSGGADSVCLLDCLLALSGECKLSVSAAHVNHGLRGQDADEDEDFVRSLCKERGVSLYVHKADVRALAQESKTGLEEAGRTVRYAFFHELQKDYGFDKIATAHHAGDNVETVFMRLIRGTGPQGLGGIPYQNESVIRPLLDTTRQDIENYLNQKGLSYRTDLSNFETHYTRNRIRHELLPFIEEKFNPNFSQAFQEQIRLYSACGAYIKEEAEKLLGRVMRPVPNGWGFACRALLEENDFLVSTMLHQVMTQAAGGQEISLLHVDAVMTILRKQQGAVSLPDNTLAEVCHGILYIRKNVPLKPYSYALQPELFMQESGYFVKTFEMTEMPKKQGKNSALLDLNKLKGKKLMFRSRKEGDIFYPVGMEGRKKLQDFFVDLKVPRFLRDSVPILTADDEIVWVAGYRCDRRFAATKETNAILCVKIHKGELS